MFSKPNQEQDRAANFSLNTDIVASLLPQGGFTSPDKVFCKYILQ